ncbi:predicted protein [Brucella pinnipedialis M163/99/10]|nr:predicted protein [Brucella pinnipedialis M163/99/10]
MRNGNAEAENMIANLTAKYNAAGMDGASIAIAKLSGMVRQQATLLSFIDVFFILTMMFCSLAICAMLLRKPSPAAGGGGGGH